MRAEVTQGWHRGPAPGPASPPCPPATTDLPSQNKTFWPCTFGVPKVETKLTVMWDPGAWDIIPWVREDREKSKCVVFLV